MSLIKNEKQTITLYIISSSCFSYVIIYHVFILHINMKFVNSLYKKNLYFFIFLFLFYLIFPIPYFPVVTSLNKLTSGGKYVNITKHINKNIRIITDKLSVKTVLSSSLFINLYATYSPIIMLIINNKMTINIILLPNIPE